MPRALAIPTVAVTLLLLTACSPSTGDDTPAPPTASASAPIFASEEEAVAAADAVIKEYWATANEVLQAGGEGAENFESVVTPRRLASERSVAESFVSQQLVQIGEFTVEPSTFQQSYETADHTEIVVTACVDYSGVTVVNPDGLEAKRTNPQPRVIHQVTLRAVGTPEDPEVRLDKSEPWFEVSC